MFWGDSLAGFGLVEAIAALLCSSFYEFIFNRS